MEADAQLAFLDRFGFTGYTMSTDNDLIVHGCRRVIFEWDWLKMTGRAFALDSIVVKRGTFTEVFETDSGARCTFPEMLPILRLFAALSGCDYCKFEGIGAVRAIDALRLASEPSRRRRRVPTRRHTGAPFAASRRPASSRTSRRSRTFSAVSASSSRRMPDAASTVATASCDASAIDSSSAACAASADADNLRSPVCGVDAGIAEGEYRPAAPAAPDAGAGTKASEAWPSPCTGRTRAPAAPRTIRSPGSKCPRATKTLLGFTIPSTILASNSTFWRRVQPNALYADARLSGLSESCTQSRLRHGHMQRLRCTEGCGSAYPSTSGILAEIQDGKDVIFPEISPPSASWVKELHAGIRRDA